MRKRSENEFFFRIVFLALQGIFQTQSVPGPWKIEGEVDKETAFKLIFGILFVI